MKRATVSSRIGIDGGYQEIREVGGLIWVETIRRGRTIGGLYLQRDCVVELSRAVGKVAKWSAYSRGCGRSECHRSMTVPLGGNDYLEISHYMDSVIIAEKSVIPGALESLCVGDECPLVILLDRAEVEPWIDCLLSVALSANRNEKHVAIPRKDGSRGRGAA